MRRALAVSVAVAVLSLFAVSMAGAVEPAPLDLAGVTAAAPAMSALAPANCNASPQLADLLLPAATALQAPPFPCGSCSVPKCRNVAINTSCGTGGLHCVVNNDCSEKPLTFMCLCATMPPTAPPAPTAQP